MGTWAITEVCRLSFAQITTLGGGSGSSIPVSIVKSLASSRQARESLSYWLALGSAVLTLRLPEITNRQQALSVSTSGGLCNYQRADGNGQCNHLFTKKLRISPDAAFLVNDWTAFIIFIVVIGGIGTIEGPIMRTLIFFSLREILADLGTVS